MKQSEASEMNPRRWERLMQLFEQAAALDDGARVSFLDQECDGDSELRREVESLLVADSITDSRLDQPLFRLREAAKSDLVGRRIGAYEIVKELGRGGLGAVYLAERADQFDQQVALKLIKRGMDTDEVVRRFHNERQILANLKHPNIARLLDGGTTDDGLPYFVMERVEGKAIDRYCDDQKLPIRARLELFLKVCSAVHHAHQNLVVHRDLKPGNILVSDGEPKLLDFGIAKLLAPDGASPETLTRLGSTPMTLRYASPEQVRNEPITTGSDVYSLGVLLYELLTGHPPYRLDGGGAADWAQQICDRDQPPTKPSTAVRRREVVTTPTGVTSLSPESVSAARKASPRKLRRGLTGDLDSIVLKALRKEPRHRYGSVEQLADDIRRHLDGLPVQAREGKTLYRTAKFIQRNRLRLAAALALLIAITGTVARQQQLASQAERSEIKGREAAARAEEARVQSTMYSQFLDKLLTPADVKLDQRFTARELLNRAQERITSQMSGESLADQLEILGLFYNELGLRDQAGKLLGEVMRMRRRLHDGDHALLARTLNNVASWHYRGREYEAAEPLYRQALEMRRRLGDPEIDLARTMSNLASTLMQRGDYRRAEALYQQALEVRQEAYGPDDRQVATSLRSLGNLLLTKGDFEAAEPLLREALRVRRLRFGERSEEVAAVQSTLGRVLHARGELAAAEDLFRQALEVRLARGGEEDLLVASTRKDLAAVRLSQGRVAEAEELLSGALAILSEGRPDSWELADARSVRGACLVAQGRYEEAEPLLRQSALHLKKLRPESVYTRNARRRLEQLYKAWGKDPPGG